jgi:transposase
VRHKRASFRGRAAGIAADRFVFLDETGVNTAMARLYGRAPRGERLVGKVPQAHWQMTTQLAGIRADGVVAPFAMTGAMDGLTFEAYGEQILPPCLRPGDIVVLDRLPAHRRGAVARAIRRAGAGLWYLPPYSPDDNPIEKIGAKVKARLRQAAARTQEALYEALRQAVSAVTAQDCQHCLAHCGYQATPVCEPIYIRVGLVPPHLSLEPCRREGSRPSRPRAGEHLPFPWAAGMAAGRGPTRARGGQRGGGAGNSKPTSPHSGEASVRFIAPPPRHPWNECRSATRKEIRRPCLHAAECGGR